jgi:serine/threonine protein kinase
MQDFETLNYLEIIYKTKDIEIVLAQVAGTPNQVCIKRYKNSNSQVFSSLENEINFLYSLNHKNILKILGHKFHPDNSVELILEYCSRRDLCDEINRRLKESQPWSEQQLLKIIEELISAFKYLQTQKIAHRDVKPDNILVTQDGTCKVTDMGSSKRVFGLNSKTIVGTAYYMSPEMRSIQNTGSLRNHSKTEKDAFKSDVWSLGLTFLVLVSYKSVEDFSDLNKIEMTLKYRINELRQPYLSQIIQAMLVPDIERRPDFIDLEKITEEIIINARTCLICHGISEDICWCLNCYAPYHPVCLKRVNFLCKKCTIDNQNLNLSCLNCEAKFSINQVKACNHIYCDNCCWALACTFCLEFPIYEYKYIEINDFIPPETWCRDCYSLRQPDRKSLKCTKCQMAICMTCKDQLHPNIACSKMNRKYQVLCRCQMVRNKDPGSLFIECPICKYICVVCFKSTVHSHFNCIQLFNTPVIQS